MANTSIDYFDRMYETPDPWGYESSWYEQRKYRLTLASLGRPTYGRVFEPGCSIGVLSELLAHRCCELVASDFHRGALDRAADRMAERRHVHLEQLEVPRQWPDGEFDLIVISELAYYLEPTDHARLMERTLGSLRPSGEVVLVHYRGQTDYPQTGDEVHERWRSDPRFDVASTHLETDFRMDVLHLAGTDPAVRAE